MFMLPFMVNKDVGYIFKSC